MTVAPSRHNRFTVVIFGPGDLTPFRHNRLTVVIFGPLESQAVTNTISTHHLTVVIFGPGDVEDAGDGKHGDVIALYFQLLHHFRQTDHGGAQLVRKLRSVEARALEKGRKG